MILNFSEGKKSRNQCDFDWREKGRINILGSGVNVAAYKSSED
jgi:hypothetical protein